MPLCAFLRLLAALLLPGLLDRVPERPLMLFGGAFMFLGLVLGLLQPGFLWLLALWFVIGTGSSLVQTPIGRLLRCSCREDLSQIPDISDYRDIYYGFRVARTFRPESSPRPKRDARG